MGSVVIGLGDNIKVQTDSVTLLLSSLCCLRATSPDIFFSLILPSSNVFVQIAILWRTEV